MKYIKSYNQETLWIPFRVKKKKKYTKPHHSKTAKTKDKNKFMKAARRKKGALSSMEQQSYNEGTT